MEPLNQNETIQILGFEKLSSELVHIITSYLSQDDLLGCTMVNRALEMAARQHLLTYNRKLDLEQVNNYIKCMSVRGNCHKLVEPTVTHSWEQPEFTRRDVIQILELLLVPFSTLITTLELRWGLGGGGQSHDLLKVVKSFPNLVSISFYMSSIGHGAKGELENHFTENWSLPNVKTLKYYNPSHGLSGIEVYPGFKDDQDRISRQVAHRLFSKFRNVEHLTLVTIPVDIILSSLEQMFWKIKSFSLVDVQPIRIQGLNLPQLSPPPNLKTFRAWISTSRESPNNVPLQTALKHFAPNLENLEIIYRHDNDETLETPFFVPILPKLRSLKIKRVIHYSPHRMAPPPPHKEYLQFQTGDKANMTKLEYPTQFPCLESLIVILSEHYYRQKLDINEEIYYQTCFPFLTESFRLLNVEPCKTLRTLDLSFGDLPRNSLQNRNCRKWDVRNLSKFFERISVTFPNMVVSKLLEDARQLVKREEIAMVREGERE